jgi:tetratricopeptide (TPR) repeat protein
VTLATTPSFTITIVQHTADHDNKQLDSITLSRDVILDQSVKQSSGCVKYDLQPYLHSHYPAIIAGLHVQFAAQGNSGASLDQSGFSAFLYVSVIHGSSAISMLHGILAPVINLFRYPIADHEGMFILLKLSVSPDKFSDSHLGVNIILLLLRQMQSSAQSKMQINEDILLMVHERVLLLSNTQENKSQFLNALGDIHLDVYQTSHAVHHLHQAVLVYDQAVQLTSDDNLVKANYLNDLGMALYSCFTQLGGIDDINKSVATLEHALKLIPDHYPDKYALCNNLGRSLYARFGQLGNVGDLDQTMLMYETAVQHTPDNHPNKAASLNNLGILFQRRFEQLGDSIDLNKCIGIYEKALELTPDTHPNKPGIWNNFSGLLLRHAEQTDDMSNIDKSISMLQYAVQNVPNSHLDKSLLLGNLGTSFICRFHHLGNIDDINQSILMLKEAVELSSDGQPSRPSLLSSLGNSLIQCFEYLHKTSDLEQAMFVLKEAVQLTSNSNPDKPVRLNNLSHAYGLYFDWFGDISHLNKSISTIEDALKLMPDNHSKKPFIWSTLGGSLLVRFDQLGDVRDVNQSISILEHAIQITPNGHSDKPTMWSNLGMALLHCFERSGETKDIGYSILALENAIQLAPDGHLSKSQMFSTISNSLLCRFEKLGNSNDIDKSVIMSKNAMDHTADGHPNKPLVLNSLGKSLFCRYKHLHHDSDFKESIAILGEALKITPSQHPFQPTLLSNLGDMHSYNFRQHRNIQDMVSALSYYSMATSSPTGYPFLRFSVAAKWASYANEFPGISHNSVLEAYTVALNVLPQLAWLGLSIKDRQFNLLEVGRVVRNAISTAIEHGQHALALEWMEQGRSVIWGQLLQLRTPVDDLREAHPELAKKLEQLSKQLEVAGTDRLSDSHHIRNQLPPEAVAQHSHDLADERDKLITTIQKLDGFQRFLLPQTISQLLPAASAGSVVTVNVSANRCDVLIIKSDLGIMHIPLEQFTLADAKDLYKSLRVLLAYKGALREAERKGGPAPANHLLKDPDAEFEKILSKLWVGIAKPVLDGLAITVSCFSSNTVFLLKLILL